MISHQYRCIFIHIPKCAGTSIEMALGWHVNGVTRDAQDHRRIINLQRAIWPPNRDLFGTAEFAHYIRQQLFAMRRGHATPSKNEFDDYFKFSIVRNPWDRVHSWYRNVVRDPLHRRHFRVSMNCSFEEFIDRHINCWALDLCR